MCGGEGGGTVGETELEGAEEEEEGEEVDGVDGELVGVLEPEEEHGPDLRVHFLEEEGEAGLCYANAAVPTGGVDEGADGEELTRGGGGVLRTEERGVAAAVDDVVQDAFPLGGGIIVEELDRDVGILGGA